MWQRCDGATPLETIAEAVQLCLGAADSRALVSATLRELANADLLVESGEVAGPDATRRALLQRGIAAALLPVVHSIVAPEPLAAQSLGAPTLTGIAPGIGARSVTVRVTLTGTNFAVGNTTVAVSGSGVTVANVNVVSPTSLTTDFAISGAAVVGARLFTIATPAGSADGVFTVVPFVTTFSFIPGGPQSFTVPAGVTSLTIAASGGEGGPADGARGGLGGSSTATIDVTPGEALAIFVGGAGVRGTNVKTVQGGFNGGGLGPPTALTGAGSGAGASDVRRGTGGLADRMIVAGGGGGAGSTATGAGVAGGAGGGTVGGSGGSSAGATGGGGGTQSAGGAGGTGPIAGESGSAGVGGDGPSNLSAAGGGGGGGWFGGGSGGAGGGGGGGSSWAVASARNVTTTSGDRAGNGQVIISF